jgi:glutamate formiminotransferase / 5-formyltetrahydrofolate cyclo-ligase
MRILSVPNWSMGRNNTVLRQVRDELESRPIALHFLAGDVDHNRTVMAVSGEREAVREALLASARLILPAIDLNRHSGCHPRIGALDVCPFIPFEEPDDPDEFRSWIEGFAFEMAEEWDIPVFLYEKSARAEGKSALPDIRKGGFGGLLERELPSDIGPRKAHPLLGASVVGWRPFLIALNLNLRQESGHAAATLVQKIKSRRKDDPMFEGVRALAFYLTSRGQSQLSMNLTRPSLTPIDPILRWAIRSAETMGAPVEGPELIGVLRPRDLEHCTLCPVQPSQIVEMN